MRAHCQNNGAVCCGGHGPFGLSHGLLGGDHLRVPVPQLGVAVSGLGLLGLVNMAVSGLEH